MEKDAHDVSIETLALKPDGLLQVRDEDGHGYLVNVEKKGEKMSGISRDSNQPLMAQIRSSPMKSAIASKSILRLARYTLRLPINGCPDYDKTLAPRSADSLRRPG